MNEEELNLISFMVEKSKCPYCHDLLKKMLQELRHQKSMCELYRSDLLDLATEYTKLKNENDRIETKSNLEYVEAYKI